MKSDQDKYVLDWFDLGYTKYMLGDFDRALMVFSFAAGIQHLEAMKSAGYIWSKNLTKSLTCNLGHHKLCAAYYYMQACIRKDEEAWISLSNTVYSLEKEGFFKDETVKHFSLGFSYLSVSFVSKSSNHATFNEALFYYEGDGIIQNKTKAFEILDKLYEKAKEGDYDLFLPVLLAKS